MSNICSMEYVSTKYFTFAQPPDELVLESGQKLGPITVAYEIYGKLNSQRNNVILICHALSGDAHISGYHSNNESKPGWWDKAVGEGKIFDTGKYFIICSNVLGGCSGTTGPQSINPLTLKPYGLDFPVITINDMVRVQKKLLDYLHISKLYSIVGGSMGGMQTLEWMTSFPEMIDSAIVIASTTKHSALAIALNAVGRQAIMYDPNWNNGNYYRQNAPKNGLAVARMIGHISYLSDESMNNKFGRRLITNDSYSFKFYNDFQVEEYLEHQGKKFVNRFDANCYLYITKAIDYFDLEKKYSSLQQAFKNFQGKVLVISFTSDWLYPTYQSLAIVSALRDNNINVSFVEIESSYGHDAFLIEIDKMYEVITEFLSNE